MPPRRQHAPRAASGPAAEGSRRRGGEEEGGGGEETLGAGEEDDEQDSEQAALRVRLVQLEHGHRRRRQLRSERCRRHQQSTGESGQFYS